LYTCEAEKDNESDSAESINEEMGNFQNETSNLIEDNTQRISLAAITCITQPQTLKLKGHIKNDNVIVLIDIGSTHNFLYIKIAGKLNLFVYLVPDMKVMVADGKTIGNVGKCHKMKLQIQDFNLESKLRPFGRSKCGFRNLMVTKLGHIFSQSPGTFHPIQVARAKL
jgi:hypothetical protein